LPDRSRRKSSLEPGDPVNIRKNRLDEEPLLLAVVQVADQLTRLDDPITATGRGGRVATVTVPAWLDMGLVHLKKKLELG